jgi:hypothetical protein
VGSDRSVFTFQAIRWLKQQEFQPSNEGETIMDAMSKIPQDFAHLPKDVSQRQHLLRIKDVCMALRSQLLTALLCSALAGMDHPHDKHMPVHQPAASLSGLSGMLQSCLESFVRLSSISCWYSHSFVRHRRLLVRLLISACTCGHLQVAGTIADAERHIGREALNKTYYMDQWEELIQKLKDPVAVSSLSFFLFCPLPPALPPWMCTE